MSNSPSQVPGGGLVAHEQAGGHTLAKHVGKTEAELQARLAQEPRSRVSTFTDYSTAEAIIAEAIADSQTTILAWLSTNPSQTLTISYTAKRTAGFYLVRGTTTLVPSSHILVVLKPNPSLVLGYYILTAYIAL